MTGPQTDTHVGRKLGAYRLERLLGKGGMGAVYLATDTMLDRPCAVKVLSGPAAGTPERRRRFVREGRAAARLQHPNIAAIFSAGEDDGIAYIAMEYIPGASLRERLRAGTVSDDQALLWLRQLADALAHAHASGVVHRDIKPENLVIDDTTGTLKVLDFGLAKLAEEEIDAVDGEAITHEGPFMTHAGVILGTPGYMAPEQMRGEPAGPSSDIFAVGCVAYELFTGRGPFAARTPVDVIARAARVEFDPLPDVRPDLAASIIGTIELCLEEDPSRRLIDGGALRAALAVVSSDAMSAVNRGPVSGEAVTIASPPAGGPPPSTPNAVVSTPTATEVPTSAIGMRIGLLVLVGALVAVGAVLLNRPPAPDPPPIVDSDADASTEPDPPEQTGERAIPIDLPVPATSWVRGSAVPPVLSPAGDRVAVATEESVVLIELETGDRVEHALEFMPEAYGLSWFPDGSALALSIVTIEREREAFRVDADTGQATQLLEHGGPVAIDPGGERLAFLTRSSLVVSGIDGSDPIAVATLEPGTVTALEWSLDGQSLAWMQRLGDQTELRTASASPGAEITTLAQEEGAGRVAALGASQNGWFVALGDAQGGSLLSLVPNTRQDDELHFPPIEHHGDSIIGLQVVEDRIFIAHERDVTTASVAPLASDESGLTLGEPMTISDPIFAEMPTDWWDDDTLLVQSSRNVSVNSLLAVDAETGAPRVLVSEPWSATWATADSDSSFYFWSYGDDRHLSLQHFSSDSFHEVADMGVEVDGAGFAPFDRRVVCASQCYLGRETDAGSELVPVQRDGHIGPPILALDNNSLAFADVRDAAPAILTMEGNRMRTWSLDGSPAADIELPDSAISFWGRWLPGSDTVIAALAQRVKQGLWWTISEIRADGEVHVLRECGEEPCDWAIPSPDGSRLAWLDRSARLRLMESWALLTLDEAADDE